MGESIGVRASIACGLRATCKAGAAADTIAAARLLWGSPASAHAIGDVAKFDVADFVEPLQRWLRAQQTSPAEARMAMLAVVMELCRRGYDALLLPPPPSVTARLREMVMAQPALEWKSAHFEDALAVSSATLRRRLSAEGTTLRDVITSARLACALELLYTTRWPIKTVAAKVGYRSASSFVRRFSERYGMEPARIGNAATH